MKKICFPLLCFFLLGSSFSQEKKPYSENQLLVKFKSNSNIPFVNQKFDNPALTSLNEKFEIENIKILGTRKKSNSYILTFKSHQDIPYLIDLYMKTNLFEYVEPNHTGSGSGFKIALETTPPNDPFFFKQWGLFNDGTFTFNNATITTAKNDADIDMELAWDIEQGDPSIIVAVIDTGMRLDHPDIIGRIWVNSEEVPNDGIDNDNNGFIDDVNGWDFVNNDNNPTDDNGHGSNVTGIIGANGNNNIGFSGVDRNCKLMICKGLDSSNSGFINNWIQAMEYAIDNGAKVINMSLTSTFNNSFFRDAVNFANSQGVTVVAAMGNNNNDVVNYPAAYSNTIAVGATNAIDERAVPFSRGLADGGSNFADYIDVVAPGDYIFGLRSGQIEDYDFLYSGTSQATPHVTGLCSLLLAQDSTRTPEDLRSIITETAEDQVGNLSEDISGFDNFYGYGRINAHQALLQSVLSIDAIGSENNTIVIYPNPASEFFNIESNFQINRIRISNILGQEVYKNNTAADNQLIKVDVRNMAPGLYLLNMLGADGKVIKSQKIILK